MDLYVCGDDFFLFVFNPQNKNRDQKVLTRTRSLVFTRSLENYSVVVCLCLSSYSVWFVDVLRDSFGPKSINSSSISRSSRLSSRVVVDIIRRSRMGVVVRWVGLRRREGSRTRIGG